MSDIVEYDPVIWFSHHFPANLRLLVPGESLSYEKVIELLLKEGAGTN
jgi:hypothetical protein